MCIELIMALKQDIEEITARIDFCESSLSQLRKDLLVYLSKRSGYLLFFIYFENSYRKIIFRIIKTNNRSF
jgi:hypothetical protein